MGATPLHVSRGMHACSIRACFVRRIIIIQVSFQVLIDSPHSTGRPPAELLMGRQPDPYLMYILRPSIAPNIRRKQEKQKIQHDAHAHPRLFQVGDHVYVRDFSSGHSTPAWIKGEVMECRGPLSYAVRLADGRVVRRQKG